MPKFQVMILLELYSHFLEVEVTGVFRWVSGRGRGYGGHPLFIYLCSFSEGLGEGDVNYLLHTRH